MRIALFSYAWEQQGTLFNPGVETVAVSLARALSNRANVTAFVSASTEGEVETYGIDVRTVRRKINSGLFQVNQYTFARDLLARYSHELREFDVLHDIGSQLPAISNDFRNRGIVTFHHDEPPRTLRQILQYPLLCGRFARERNAWRVVAPSSFAKKQIAARNGIDPKKVVVIPHGVDSKIFCPKQLSSFDSGVDGIPELLFVGGMSQRKDPLTLLRAAQLLRRRNVRFRVRLVGSGPQESRLRKWTVHAKLTGLVSFQHYLTKMELADAYRRASVVVIPSRIEGFSLVTLEAMASGTPLVTSDIPALRELIGDAGLFFEPGNFASLASAIQLLLSDPQRWKALRELSLARSRSFNWENVACQHMSLYNDLLVGRT